MNFPSSSRTGSPLVSCCTEIESVKRSERFFIPRRKPHPIDLWGGQITCRERFKNETQRSPLLADSVHVDSLFCHRPSTCTDQSRCCHDPIRDIFPHHSFAGGNLNFDCASPSQLHRGGVLNSGGTDWSFRGLARTAVFPLPRSCRLQRSCSPSAAPRWPRCVAGRHRTRFAVRQTA